MKINEEAVHRRFTDMVLSGHHISYVPEGYRSGAMVDYSCRHHAKSLAYLDTENLSMENLRAAVAFDPCNIRFVSDNVESFELWLIACTKEPSYVTYAPDRYKNELKTFVDL